MNICSHPLVDAPNRDAQSAPRRGMVLWLTLVAMLFFVSLVLYVFNLGHHVEQQEKTQDAADAAAIGEAGALARQLNLVASNNVEMTRLIAAAQLLDAMPQATAYTLADQEAMLESLQKLSPPNSSLPGSGQTAATMCNATISDLQAQVDALRPVVDNFYSNYTTCSPDKLENLTVGSTDIRESTWYQTPTGAKGSLWKAVDALDKVSQGVVSALPDTLQRNATASAIKVQGNGSKTLGAAVPFQLHVPCKRGAFDDFYNPIIKGRIPDTSGTSDPIKQRGPFDSVFGWVYPKRGPGTPGIPGIPNGPAAPGDGSPFGGGSSGTSGGTPAIPGPIIGYYTAGAFIHDLRFFAETVGGRALWWGWGNGVGQWGSLPGNIGVNTDLTYRVGQMALQKLVLAQSNAAPWSNAPADLQRGASLQKLRIPSWIYPFDNALGTAKTAANDPSAPINGRNAYAVWIRIENPSPAQPAANWEITKISQNRRFFNPPPPKGGGPAGAKIDMFFEAPQTPYRLKLADGVFVIFTPVPILDPVTGAVIGTNPTNPVLYLWAGINASTQDVVIENPNNWSAGADLPAPTDFLPQAAAVPTGPTPGQWDFLGFAASPNAGPSWGGSFKSANYQRHVGLAQARVFNNHSWDLWTPMFHAQLCPISDYNAWLGMLQNTSSQATADNGVNITELPKFITHLQAIKPLAPLITH